MAIPIDLPPECTRAPAILGNPQIGSILTVDPGSWVDDYGPTPISITTSWEARHSASSVSLGSSNSREVDASLVGWEIRVLATATDLAGHSTTAASAWLPIPAATVQAAATDASSTGGGCGVGAPLGLLILLAGMTLRPGRRRRRSWSA